MTLSTPCHTQSPSHILNCHQLDSVSQQWTNSREAEIWDTDETPSDGVSETGSNENSASALVPRLTLNPLIIRILSLITG